MPNQQKIIVLSLGGSLIVPDKIDTKFLSQFRALILSYSKRGYRFAIICGGGSIARKYQQAAAEIFSTDNTSLDWLGIEATKLNASLLRTVFGEDACDQPIQDPTISLSFGKRGILIASGWKPGWSTDYDAILLAKTLKSKTVINMSNVNYVYDSDPKKNKDAKPLKKISWKEYRKMAGDTWIPGMNLPFDPIASREADSLGMRVYIVGSDLKNLEKILNDRSFDGTVIS